MKNLTNMYFLWMCFVFCVILFQFPIRDAFIEALNPGVKREIWQAIPGDTVGNLTSSFKYQNQPPDLLDIRTSLDAPSDIGESYGQRLTTYFLAPETGDYYFYMSCDFSCQLWISTDVSLHDVLMIIEIEPPGRIKNRDWQKSNTPFYMVEKNFYFLQVLMKEQNGTDFLSVGVDFPSNSSFKPLREPFLFLESPEQLAGSFILVENAFIPQNGVIRSYQSASQPTCAHHCIRYITGCQSYSYHVITKECVLYVVTGTQSNSAKSDHNIRLYKKIM